jgi:hypothetical protein
VEIRRRGLQVAAIRESIGDEADTNETIRLVVREVAKQNPVDDGSNANSRSDSDAERRYDSSGKAWRTAHPTNREARVTSEIVDGHDTTCIARCFLESARPTEAEQSSAPSVAFTHSPANVLGRFHLEVKREFFALLGGVP